MKNQLRIPFESINWELYCKRGALLATPDKEELLIGFGERLTDGEITFFQQDFFNERRWEYVPEFISSFPCAQLAEFADSEQAVEILFNEDELYLQDLQKALASFDEEFEKVVLISRETYAKKGIALLDLLGRLARGQLGYHYGMWDENGGMLGSTPEILFHKQGQAFKSMALASTKPYEEREELLTDPKEQREHQLVIQDIQNKLAGQKNIQVAETGLQRFGNLAHLRTDIQFESDLSAKEIVDRLSPTAALGGYPMELSKRFIKGSGYYQKYPKRKFGGIIGVEREQDAFALVAIRNIQWDKDVYWIECGGGVVKDSVAANEMAEIRRKRQVIKDLYFHESL